MIAVVGGGVVGLSIARALALRGREAVVLERHRRPGLDASTHNSGVIHAGLYHPPDSLKTRLCIDGRERLIAFAEAHGVRHVRCGKLIVAQEGEDAALERLAAGAAANGVTLEEVSPTDLRAREPHIRATRALWSPVSGWIEAEGYIRALEHELQRLDVPVLVGTPLVGCDEAAGGLRLATPREQIEVTAVVNAAGLHADDVSRLCGGEDFTIYPCRGEYAELAPRVRGLVRGLVYPVPHPSGHGLGVHFTKTLDGAVWIGPTIEYRDAKDDYETGRLRLEAFLEPTQAFLPGLTIDDLRLSGSGIRAKLHPPTESFADFMVRADTRQPRLLHAAGIDSPGLTASLAIAERLADLAAALG